MESQVGIELLFDATGFFSEQKEHLVYARDKRYPTGDDIQAIYICEIAEELSTPGVSNLQFVKHFFSNTITM